MIIKQIQSLKTFLKPHAALRHPLRMELKGLVYLQMLPLEPPEKTLFPLKDKLKLISIGRCPLGHCPAPHVLSLAIPCLLGHIR